MSLSIPAGQTVALIGPSGGGKSTLLRCINGLNDFDEGAIQVGSHMLRARNGNDAACRPVRRLLGMVFQDFQLFPHLTALGNVMEGPTQVLHLTRRQARERGLALLERVGLADRAEFHPHQLSGGQKQRVAIARALAMEPKGLLCDEITSALDPELKNEVLNVLEDLKKDGMTLLMVTHEIGFARKAAEQVVVLAEGKVLEQGPPGEVLDHPKTSRLQQFLRRVLG
jgi:polar amino acid transport system ATP-binding protein